MIGRSAHRVRSAISERLVIFIRWHTSSIFACRAGRPSQPPRSKASSQRRAMTRRFRPKKKNTPASQIGYKSKTDRLQIPELTQDPSPPHTTSPITIIAFDSYLRHRVPLISRSWGVGMPDHQKEEVEEEEEKKKKGKLATSRSLRASRSTPRCLSLSPLSLAVFDAAPGAQTTDTQSAFEAQRQTAARAS